MILFKRLLLVAVLTRVLLPTSGEVAQAQTRPGFLKESAYARARRAAEVRDSLIGLGPTIDSAGRSAGIEPQVLTFIKEPFTPSSPPPSLAQLDNAQAQVNHTLSTLPSARIAARRGPGSSNAIAATAANTAVAWLPSPFSLAVGVTDFVVERAKDEVAFGFVLSLKRSVQDDAFIRETLPRSHNLVVRIETETFQTFMPLLRSAFVEDLNEFPTRTNAIATQLGLGNEQITYLQGVAIAYKRGLEIRRGAAPAVALSNLVELNEQEITNASIRRALQVVGLISREYSAAGGEALVQEFAQKDRGWLRRYFVASIAHDIADLNTLLVTSDARHDWLNYLSSREADAMLVIHQLHSVRNSVRNFRASTDSTEEAADRIVAAAGAMLQVMQTAPRFAYLPGTAMPEEVQSLERFVADATLLHQALTRRDYGSIVTWLVQNPHLRLCNRTSVSAAGPAVAASTRLQSEEQRRDAEAGKPSRCEQRMKYLSFGASLAAARNAEEVATAVRTASSPVGSYRAKRGRSGAFGPQSASLIGYIGGGYYSTERPDADYGRAGVALPLGAELTMGIPWGAVSLFVPVVDLGPVANARLFDDDDLAESDIDLDHLFAPGAFVVLNASRTLPLSLGLGIQSARQIRRTSTGQEREVNVGRTLFFVAIDATLLHFRF